MLENLDFILSCRIFARANQVLTKTKINMKLNGLFVALLFVCGFASAQTPTFEKGDKVLNLGIGFGGYGTWGYHPAVPPVSASFEVGIVDDVIDKGTIGIGGFLAYASYKETGYYGDSYWSFNRMVIGARGSLHYPFVDKLDTYGGLMLGFNSNTWNWHGSGSERTNDGGSGLGFSLYAGARYYFSEKFAAMGELGYGISYLNLGIALKF
jgi:hypothetical protein